MSAVMYPNTLWLGVPNMSVDQLKNFDPAYTGYVQIFVTRVPPVLEMYDKKYGTSHGQNFKAIFERVTTSFTGIPELTIETQAQIHGFADRKIEHATVPSFAFDTGTFRALEFKDMPVHGMVHTWAEMVAGDVISKIKDYKGLAKDMPNGYSLANHSASFIIANTTADLTKINGRAHYITAAFPTSLSFDMFNWNAGEIGIVEGIDIPMKGVIRWGSEVDAKAMQLIANRLKVINYYSGNKPGGAQFLTPGGSLNGQTIVPQTTIM